MIDLMEKCCFKAIFLSSTTVFHPNKRSGCQDWGGLSPPRPPPPPPPPPYATGCIVLNHLVYFH